MMQNFINKIIPGYQDPSDEKIFTWSKIKISLTLLWSVFWRALIFGILLQIIFFGLEFLISVISTVRIELNQQILDFIEDTAFAVIIVMLRYKVLYEIEYKGFERILPKGNLEFPKMNSKTYILKYFGSYLIIIFWSLLSLIICVLLFMSLNYFLKMWNWNLALIMEYPLIDHDFDLGVVMICFAAAFISLTVEHYLIHKNYWLVKFRAI